MQMSMTIPFLFHDRRDHVPDHAQPVQALQKQSESCFCQGHWAPDGVLICMYITKETDVSQKLQSS